MLSGPARGGGQDRAARERDRHRGRGQEALRPRRPATSSCPRPAARASTRARPPRTSDGGGRFGDVEVDSASGDVSFAAVDGRLEVNTASGDINVDSVGGDLRANSASGDITIGAAEGDAKVRTASGRHRHPLGRTGQNRHPVGVRRRRGRHPPRLEGLHRRELDERRHVLRSGRHRCAAARVGRPEHRLPGTHDERRREGAARVMLPALLAIRPAPEPRRGKRRQGRA